MLILTLIIKHLMTFLLSRITMLSCSVVESTPFTTTGAFESPAVPAFHVNDEEIDLTAVPLNSP